MPWTDWACIGLCLAASLVEARRGSLAALVDLLGVLVALPAAERLHPLVVSEAVDPGIAYLLVLGALLLITVMVSWQVQTATARPSGPADFTVAAVAGAFVGLALGYGLFHFVLLYYGDAFPPYQDSTLRPIVHDLTWLKPLANRLGVRIK
ncbi:MAG: CvpA family protein [Armatimonadetes bacterium]|nr:CvpA family protein [Armatimonadota bacterium]